MREYVLVFVGSVLLAAASFWFLPLEGECQGDCPAYNTRCISDLGCKPLQCDMRCVITESGRSRRCR